ncbi:GSU2403 family nucleotidyltransferase fold protein [Janthinobacterium sp. NKUCC08_JDC]|uniref:GSU2403 family nucleotidyltransferase fold protein n=1 Tax=Janthinobacterium sp. NKUCC08_JDC TaxID=2842122 RepID=UPI001C5B8FDB|nr:GSU2403 family nucleotidyltransferase fold protein [Janthinobacterium sp. NKUCC08_JDC]MBW3498452.1 nucleotidyltransferase domain-containing protein [Janthinobacterium sp. NKUCC08_JDC]
MRERPADATRQYIDAVATFEAYEDALAEAAKVRGGMYWHKGPASAPDDAYLVRTSASGSEKSLGRRSPETEAMYASFRQRKEMAVERRDGLKASLLKHKRMNRALRVGRVAPIIVDILNRLAATRLGEHFRVVGTHALYAYESAAGMTFEDDAVATRDIDLLWDVRKRVAFATALSKVDVSMLGVLQKVDPTFRIRDAQKYTAVNKDGFEVDIIRRVQVGDDPHPIRLSDEDDDFWVAQAPRAQELLDSAQFSAVIVATNGAMARMNTLEPMAFVRFKQWMSALPERDPLKRRRDALQASSVEDVVQEYLPQWSQN